MGECYRNIGHMCGDCFRNTRRSRWGSGHGSKRSLIHWRITMIPIRSYFINPSRFRTDKFCFWSHGVSHNSKSRSPSNFSGGSDRSRRSFTKIFRLSFSIHIVHINRVI